MRFLHHTWLAAGLAAMLAACAGSDVASTEAPGDGTGTARIHLITPQVFDFQLTRVSVETDTGFIVDLARDPQSGAFSGSLALPAGVHEITGRAFVDAGQVGASNPVPAEIQAGAVTQVMIQILDTTGGNQPDFGPILESLTHPASTTAGVQVILAASVIDPDGTPVSIQWAQDCNDASFTAPQDAVTAWSKATPGTCRITLTGTSGGQSLATSFSIVVFEPGANLGAVEVISEFISAPTLELQLSLQSAFCVVNRFVSNASCAAATSSPTVTPVQAFVNWENATPGSMTVFDDCGGGVSVLFQGLTFLDARWLPPAQGGICRVTVRATSLEGVVSELSAAVLVRPGTPRQPVGAPDVALNGFFPAAMSFCSGHSTVGEVFCNPTPAGSTASFDGSVFWADTLPSTIELTDSCGGAFSSRATDPASGFFSATWQAPAAPVAGCAITATARSLEGVTRSAVLRFDVQ